MAPIKIDKGIPLPSPHALTKTYPFHEMEIGDSFAIPDEKEVHRVRCAATSYGKYNNKKFTTPRIKDGTYRCWRVK